MQIIESYTLNEIGFSINFPFPEKEKKIIETAIKSIEMDSQKLIQNTLDQKLYLLLKNQGYTNDKGICSLWKPDFGKSVDLYNEEKKIAIEIEKAEVKRILHDILKMINGSNTFVPKVRYGVLIIPHKYLIKNSLKSFSSTVLQDIKFYFGNLIPAKTNLQDVLVIAYAVNTH